MLIPANKLTHEQRVINGRKGGLKAAENRRKKREQCKVTRKDLFYTNAALLCCLKTLYKLTRGAPDPINIDLIENINRIEQWQIDYINKCLDE